MTDARWQKTRDFMVSAGLLAAATDWKQAYTTEFVQAMQVKPEGDAMSLMIKNAHAILSGLPGEAARLAGPDIRIRDGKIAAIGSLTPLPEERQIDARDCVIIRRG